jgi:23S rRNA pseudoU1915 N3-methylase RlmH
MQLEFHLAFRFRDRELRSVFDRYVQLASPLRAVRVLEYGDKKPFPPLEGRAWPVLLDGRGECWSTADWVGAWRRHEGVGRQVCRLLIGGPDGWPGQAPGLDRVALGRQTMPHQLAAVVAAEQMYRIFTVLRGHPYHIGHGGQ